MILRAEGPNLKRMIRRDQQCANTPSWYLFTSPTALTDGHYVSNQQLSVLNPHQLLIIVTRPPWPLREAGGQGVAVVAGAVPGGAGLPGGNSRPVGCKPGWRAGTLQSVGLRRY